MSASEDPGMRVAKRSGVTGHMDRATRALNAAVHARALTQLRLVRIPGNTRAATRFVADQAVRVSATDGTPPLPPLSREGLNVAGPSIAVASARLTAVLPDGTVKAAPPGTTVRSDVAMGVNASQGAGPRRPAGGGLKLVMLPAPLGSSGAGAKVGADTPTTVTFPQAAAAPARVLAWAARTGAGGPGAAAGTPLAKPGGSPGGSVGTAPGRDASPGFTYAAKQAARGAAWDVERLVARSAGPVAPAGAFASPATDRSAVGPKSMAPGRAGAEEPDAGGGALPYATQPRLATAGRPERDGAADGEPAAGFHPTEGDVYLDGALMGRWIARSLAAEAARPASGSAAFDPRRNVFPTGAMIGG